MTPANDGAGLKPWKVDGAMPMMVNGVPPTLMREPSTWGGAPRRSRQNQSVRTMTAAPVCCSDALGQRPTRGANPSARTASSLAKSTTSRLAMDS